MQEHGLLTFAEYNKTQPRGYVHVRVGESMKQITKFRGCRAQIGHRTFVAMKPATMLVVSTSNLHGHDADEVMRQSRYVSTDLKSV